MFKKLISLVAKAEIFKNNIAIKAIAKKILSSILYIKNGKIDTSEYSVYVDFNDNKGVINYINYLTTGNINIEDLEINIFASSIRNNKDATIFDIGANYGMYTLIAGYIKKDIKRLSIISIEPDPIVYKCLNKSIQYNKFDEVCIPVHAAIGSLHNGKCSLLKHINQSSFNYTGASGKIHTQEYKIVDDVRTITIDGICSDLNVHPGKVIIKIDIEGNEPIALNGMKKLLESCSGYLLMIEYFVNRMDIAGTDPNQLLDTIFLYGKDGVFELDAELKSLVRLKSPASFLAKDKRYTNLLVLNNMNLPEINREYCPDICE